MTQKVTTVDEYIRQFPKSTQGKLTEIRQTIRHVLPMAEECISYAIPAYKVDKKPIIYFAGYEKHVGVYPLPHKMSAKLEEKLKPHVAGKGTLRFELDKELPMDLIKEVVEKRLREAQ